MTSEAIMLKPNDIEHGRWEMASISVTVGASKLAPQSWQNHRTSSLARHFYLYEACCECTALGERDKVRLQQYGVSPEEVERIQSIIDSHFSSLRMCLMNSLIMACVLSVLGILIILTGGEGRECGPYNCALGSFIALTPWAFYAIFAVAWACCILEAKNEKASSDLNLAFQNHPMQPYFRLTSTMHRTVGVHYDDSTAYTRHVLEISLGRTRWPGGHRPQMSNIYKNCQLASAEMACFRKNAWCWQCWPINVSRFGAKAAEKKGTFAVPCCCGYIQNIQNHVNYFLNLYFCI